MEESSVLACAPPREGAPATLAACAPVAILVVLVVLQGGYYAAATCAVALVTTIVLVVRALVRRARTGACRTRCPAAAALLLVVALCCLASALAHGLTATMLLETTRWFAVAGLALACAPSSDLVRRRMLDALAIAGVVLAVAGVLMHVGAIPFEGAVSAGRLMFTFQYANAAGLLFAVAVVLCLCDERAFVRLAALVPAAALLLTRSVGAICVLGAALVALGIARAREWGPRAWRGVALAIVVSCAAVALALPRERLAEAGQTFVERLVQQLDALALLAPRLVLGIGPDQWQLACPTIQTAQYHAADVHGSYLQVALDGGVVACAALVALVATGLRLLWARREVGPLACVAMVGTHALVDFDFEFSSVVVLLCLLVAVPAAEDAGSSVVPLRVERAGREASSGGRDALARIARVLPARAALSTSLWWVTAACAACASVVGLSVDARVDALQDACARGDGDVALGLLEADPSLEVDPLMRSAVAGALCATGRHEDVVALVGEGPAASGALGLYRSVSLNELGDEEAAARSLAETLDERPFDTDLYEAARAYLTGGKATDALADAFDDAARRANELSVTGHAVWLSSRREIELVGGGDE